MNAGRRVGYLSQGAPELAPQFLEVGVLEVTDEATREVSGLALPYGEDLDRMDWLSGATKQRFAPKSAQVRDNAAFFYGHDHLTKGLPIGRITGTSHTDAGLRITAKISATPKGDEVYTLLKDGVLDRFSVGYYGGKAHLEDDDTVLVHDEVDVFEVSVVPDPAYKSATVDKVLSHHPNPAKKEATMNKRARLAALRALSTLSAAEATELLELAALESSNPAALEAAHTAPVVVPAGLASAEDVNSLSQSVEDLTRQIATLSVGGPAPDAAPAVPGRTYGEFLQMVATPTHPEHAAAVAFLAYVGGTVADLGDLMKDTWVGDRYKFIEAQRTVLNFFASSPLPASGMGVEYGVEGTDTTQVGKQAAEGDVLPYGKINFATAHATLETFGGWGEMSFQQIQRSPINVIERYFDALLRRYAQVTEAKVNAMALAAGQVVSMGAYFAGGKLVDNNAWTRFVIRAARVMKSRGYPIEGVLVGFDVFEEMAVMPDVATANGARPFLDKDNGTVNIVGLTGNVYTLPVIPIETGATANVVRVANSQAIRTYEASGAPFRLQDDDITKLTHAASIYGYLAAALEVPGAILKPAA